VTNPYTPALNDHLQQADREQHANTTLCSTMSVHPHKPYGQYPRKQLAPAARAAAALTAQVR
jgi:hypothetical protein